MSAFDPYHKWLGIPPAEQPPNHYRLLGVGLYEQDADVIESAADRQMVHVQAQKHGPHAELSQRVLNELAAARLCLLDSHKKADYDAELRGRSAPRPLARPIAAAPPLPLPTAPPPSRPWPTASETTSPAAEADEEICFGEDSRAAPSMILERPGVAVRAPSSPGRYAGRRKKSPLPLIFASLGGGAAVLAVIIVLASNQPGREEESRSSPSPGKTTSTSAQPAAPSNVHSSALPLPDSPALWKPDQGSSPPSQEKPDPPPANPGGKPPGPVRLPDPVILGPDGQPKNGVDGPTEGEDPPAAGGPSPPVLPPAPRLPVPEDEALTLARRELRENYTEDFKSLNTDEKKFKLAEKLFKAAPLEKKGSPRRYVMWDTIRGLSEEAGIPKGAANAAGALAEEFEIAEPVLFVANAFYAAARNARTPEGRDAAVEYAPFLLHVALKHDDFAGARRVVQAGKAVAAASPSAKRGPLHEEFDAKSRGVTMLETRHRAAVAAEQTLADSPDDAAAHQALGTYQGLFKGEWKSAAPHLQRAPDADLQQLGARETAALAAAPTPKKMTELASGWTAFALRQNSPLKEAALLRARHWHHTALGKLRGENKKQAKQAIEDIDAQLEPLEFATFLDKLFVARELANSP